MSRDLVSCDVEEIVGGAFMADRLVDVEALNCSTCGALIRADWFARLRHAEWHIKEGHAHV